VLREWGFVMLGGPPTSRTSIDDQTAEPGATGSQLACRCGFTSAPAGCDGHRTASISSRPVDLAGGAEPDRLAHPIGCGPDTVRAWVSDPGRALGTYARWPTTAGSRCGLMPAWRAHSPGAGRQDLAAPTGPPIGPPFGPGTMFDVAGAASPASGVSGFLAPRAGTDTSAVARGTTASQRRR
jgi:hypothetical protein